MSGSADSEASKKDGATWPATDRGQDGDAPAFLTEQVLVRFEEGLRVQREQRARSDQPPKPDGAGELRRDTEGRRSSEPAPAFLRPGPQALRKAGFLLCALLVVLGAVALGVSLKARTAGSNDAAPVNVEGRGSVEAPRSAPPAGMQTVDPAEPPRTASVPSNNDAPPQPVKSSAAMPSLPPPLPATPSKQPLEAQSSATPADNETAVGQTPVEDKVKVARKKFHPRHARSRVRH